MTKLIIGCVISSSAFVLVTIVASDYATTGARPGLWIALVINLLNNLGFANVFPVSLALYSRAAPRAIAGTVIGVYYLFLFLANILVGIVGGWLDIMPAGQFWGIHVAAILGAATIFLGGEAGVRPPAPAAAGLTHSAASRLSAPPRSTLTSRLTPFSIIVTPNRRCMRLIVTALWVTIK